MKSLVLSNSENKVIEVLNQDNFDIVLNENSSLTLRIGNTSIKDIKLHAKIKKNGLLNVIFADFALNDVNFKGEIDLVEEGANCDWQLATLGSKNNKKSYDVSFNHKVGKTTSNMDNYGVAKDESNVTFKGCNHIYEKASESNTKQNAKIIVFDKKASGNASPILKIDENNVQASHSAIVGQLNENHMFYLMSRGLSKAQARELIINGYINPICSKFDDENKEILLNMIKEAN